MRGQSTKTIKIKTTKKSRLLREGKRLIDIWIKKN